MRLTTKGRFAVTAMADLAMQRNSGPVMLAEIRQRQQISLSYPEQLFSKLRRRALADSVRSPGGGYRLAKGMAQVPVADIIHAVDERVDSTQCGGQENCKDGEKCLTHDLWASVNQHIVNYLGAVTLKQLVDEQKAKQSGVVHVQDMRGTLAKREPTTASF